MTLEISEQVLRTRGKPQTAMVITPRAHLRLGLDSAPPDPSGMSTADRRILAEARARASRVTLCVFRGASSEGDGSWAFAPGLDTAQAQQLAARLLPGQVAVYRGMLQAGLSLFLHADWGEQETDAFRWAVDRRITELRATVAPTETLATSTDALDLWLLRNLTFFFTLSFDKLMETVLPDKLALMETRMERIRRLVGQHPTKS